MNISRRGFIKTLGFAVAVPTVVLPYLAPKEDFYEYVSIFDDKGEPVEITPEILNKAVRLLVKHKIRPFKVDGKQYYMAHIDRKETEDKIKVFF